MTALGVLAVACATFVGTHFALSHPLRAPLVARLGERGFTGAYTAVALATFYWIIHAYSPALAEAPQLLWDAGEGGRIIATALMWIGSVLFVGSLRRNPALPRPGKAMKRIDEPRGVFAITRHPMMWGFASWGIVHAIVNPSLASLEVSATIVILALAGAAGQDAKKKRLQGDLWRTWLARTSFMPFGRRFAFPDSFATVGGTLLWLAAIWAHGALGYRSAGIWTFFA